MGGVSGISLFEQASPITILTLIPPPFPFQNTLEFTANAQIFPRSLNTQIGGNSDSTYLIIQDIGTPSGQGMDFTNGFTFLYVNS